MPKQRKLFPCGHRGFGQTCQHCKHLAQQQELFVQESLQKQQERDQWLLSFESDPIDLRGLPKHIVLKARRVLTELEQGTSYHQFHGKRLRYDRQTISIPLSNDYRLLCHEEESKLIPKIVMSHEEYNVKKPGASKLGI